jgi:hypothetical protein
MSDSIKRQTKIINDIIRERTSQDQQWGGATHDDGHTVEDWYSFRSKFESRALFGARKHVPAGARFHITQENDNGSG